MASSWRNFPLSVNFACKIRDLDLVKMLTTSLIISFVALATAHDGHADQEPIAGPHKSLWYHNLPGDGGTQVSLSIDIICAR